MTAWKHNLIVSFAKSDSLAIRAEKIRVSLDRLIRYLNRRASRARQNRELTSREEFEFDTEPLKDIVEDLAMVIRVERGEIAPLLNVSTTTIVDQSLQAIYDYGNQKHRLAFSVLVTDA